MTTVEIVLSNAKDVLGLTGTVLIAVPFFRLERDKRDAAGLGNPPTRNRLLLRHFTAVKRDTEQRIEQPREPDFRATLWGLLLVGVSFVISLVLPYLAS